MLTEITLENFKCFQKRTEVPLGRFTLLTGVNSRGKSTLIQPLLLMQQSVGYETSGHRLFLNGPNIALGRYADVRSSQASRSAPMEIGFRFTERKNEITVNFRLAPDDLDDSVALIDRFSAQGVIDGKKFRSAWKGQGKPSATPAWNNLTPKVSTFPRKVARLINWNNIHYISADRLGPQEYFLKHSFSGSMFVGPRGEHSASVLHSSKQTEVRKEMNIDIGVPGTVFDQAGAWFKRLFGEGHLDVQATDTNVLLLFLSSDTSPSRLYRPSNVGFGYSYALPIIVSALIAKPGQIVIVENPEAHLHPSAQSQLILMLVRLATSGVQVVVETHSDHVLNALRVAVSEHLIKPDDLKISFFESHPERYLRNILVDSGGQIDLPDWPEGFFDQTERDFARLYHD